MIAAVTVTAGLIAVVVIGFRVLCLIFAAMHGTPFAVQAARRVHERYNFTPTVKRTMPGSRAADDFDNSLGESFGPVAAYAEINVPRPRPAGEFIAESNVDLGERS